jgi:hypothetical protein
MSYVQGTVVRLQADFVDSDTGTAVDPAEVILTIRPPTGEDETYSTADDVVNDPDVVGRFFYLLDTSPAFGRWRYQFASTGDEAVVGRQQITVRPSL